MEKIVLNIPHSSSYIPAHIEISKKMQKDIYEKTDWFTNELFIPSQITNNVIPCVFNYNRCYCDVERLIDDPMEQIGEGIIYDYGRPINENEKQIRMGLYHEHRTKLANMLYDDSLLLDCHSFYVNSQYDFCVGFNEDETKPSDVLLNSVVNYFQKMGFKIGINTPYANSIIVDIPAIKYTSLMIEVNRTLYMNKTKLEKTADFDRIKGIIEGCELLLNN